MTHCTVEKRRRAERAADAIRARHPDAAVVLADPTSAATDRWTLAITRDAGVGLGAGVLAALADAGAELRRLTRRGGCVHAVAVV